MGVDTYHGQGIVDWQRVHDAGNGFGIVKASEGLRLTDAYLSLNMHGMLKVGMIRGCYHYMRLRLDPTLQARHFMDAAESAGYDPDVDLPLVIDVEDRAGIYVNPKDSKTRRISQRQVQQSVSAFLHTVEQRTGRRCIIYCDRDFAQNELGDGYSGHPLWLAYYSDTISLPTWWTEAKFWQVTDQGSVPGMMGGADQDRFLVNNKVAGLDELIAWNEETLANRF